MMPHRLQMNIQMRCTDWQMSQNRFWGANYKILGTNAWTQICFVVKEMVLLL